MLANEPRSYRQAIAGALQALRPDVEFEEIEPERLDGEVGCRAPPAVRVDAPSWVELYTDHGSLSSVSIRSERSTVEGMEIADLLLIVDRALALICL